MSNLAPHVVRRLMKELAAVREDENITHFEIEFDKENGRGGDDISRLKASFPGPIDSPFEGGTFWVKISLMEDYPFKPPVVKFSTKVWHPNVSSQTGTICLDTLATAWSPIFTLKSVLISVQSLLASPEPDDPQDAQVAVMLRDQPKEYARVAREWSIKHAGAPRTEADLDLDDLDRGPPFRTTQQELERMRQHEMYRPLVVAEFLIMGFDAPRIHRALRDEGIPREIRRLTPEQIAAVTSRLLGD
ncbi:hypothetical protein KEM56_007110 [Ascosphaera pollenicola]|nr:hypothetical protein KEM56_007110 [Ascosphaera pollenicola]